MSEYLVAKRQYLVQCSSWIGQIYVCYLVEALGFKEFVCKRLSLNRGFTEMPDLLHQLKKYRTWVKSSGDSISHGRSE